MKNLIVIIFSFWLVAAPVLAATSIAKTSEATTQAGKKGRADLVVTKIKVKHSKKKPNVVTVEYTVKNQGAVAAPASQTSLQIGNEKPVIHKTPVIKPSDNFTDTVEYNIAKEGNYQFKAKADYNNRIQENNELNNENKFQFGFSRGF